MDAIMRSDVHSEVVVKNRNSSGCLIVKKKADVATGSGAPPVVMYKKRPKMITSGRESKDAHLVHSRGKVGAETIRYCSNGSLGSAKVDPEDEEFSRKRGREEFVRRIEDSFLGKNANFSDTRQKLEVFDFDEDRGTGSQTLTPRKRINDGNRKLLSPVPVRRGSFDPRYDIRSSRGIVTEKIKKRYFENIGSSSGGSQGNKEQPSMLREKYVDDDSDSESDSDGPIRVQGKNGVLKVMVNKRKKMMMAESQRSFNKPDIKVKRAKSYTKTNDAVKISVPICRSVPPRTEVLDGSSNLGSTLMEDVTVRKSMLNKKGKDQNQNSIDNHRPLNLEEKGHRAFNSEKTVNTKVETYSDRKVAGAKIKEFKVRRGSGTEKQRLRERIRGMLLEAGWSIDYRPRRNRDYLDAVYINPSGTAFWSIIKAYDALLKQLSEDEDKNKHGRDSTAFTPITDEVLSQLTRKTRKKMEKDLEKKQRDTSESESEKEVRETLNTRREERSADSHYHEEKLSSFIKTSGKPLKNRISKKTGSACMGAKSRSYLHYNSERPSSIPCSQKRHRRRSNKIGRCTLLVRSTVEANNSDNDGSGSFSGKRTLLSWLIDSGTVRLSQKVMYMNRRRTRVMLEGWITRDGIHCGCCSKILTVFKFELHAGSKLCQPFQNIFLDSGVSLLECQVDAWNGQEDAQNLDFLYVDIDGDDPNDDTCGICGDGGDLICCDGCPSTFHRSCLDIKILPSGDWHCPNCTCKFCGTVSRDKNTPENVTPCKLITCNMCEKKYHMSCIDEMDTFVTAAAPVVPSFCGQKCLELFGKIQKLLGVKNDLEAGFSWSLIHRMDMDLDSSSCDLSHRVEGNSKLAVALSVMDECFLPIVDRRSGTNLMRNVLYNSGSNFSRLNFGGFYTAILERNDEIISAASIRFRGRELAEMPFIGTRHFYRRQGMCRRLFKAIELVLQSLNVEKLVLPAIAEFRHAWTEIFGFSPLDDSVKKESRSMNLLAFPGVYMLQKRLPKLENNGGTDKYGNKQDNPVVPEAGCQHETGLANYELFGLNDGHLLSHGKNSEGSGSESNSHGPNSSSDCENPVLSPSRQRELPEASSVSGCGDDSRVDKNSISEEISASSPVEDTCTSSRLVNHSPVSASHIKYVIPNTATQDVVMWLDGSGKSHRRNPCEGDENGGAALEKELSLSRSHLPDSVSRKTERTEAGGPNHNHWKETNGLNGIQVVSGSSSDCADVSPGCGLS